MDKLAYYTKIAETSKSTKHINYAKKMLNILGVDNDFGLKDYEPKPLVLKNAEALSELMKPMFIEFQTNAFIVAANHPARVKAKIEKLISEGKMNNGKIIQLDKAVVFEPRRDFTTKPQNK